VLNPITEHVADFEKFKEMISLKLLAVCHELEGYKAHFKEFAKNQTTKLGAFSAFKNGEKFYCDLLDMNTG
jgi:hypothetical protein